jgi:hypothetical protein
MVPSFLAWIYIWAPTSLLYNGIKRLVCQADHSDSYNAEVKNEWSYTSTVPRVILAWCLIMHRGNFTLPYGCFICVTHT